MRLDLMDYQMFSINTLDITLSFVPLKCYHAYTSIGNDSHAYEILSPGHRHNEFIRQSAIYWRLIHLMPFDLSPVLNVSLASL